MKYLDNDRMLNHRGWLNDEKIDKIVYNCIVVIII